MPNVIDSLASLAPLVEVDHSEFGDVEVMKLSRVQKLTGAFLGRNWVTIPHVTHHDEVDVTEMESRRKDWNRAHTGSRLTPVVLLMRALASVLAEMPQFNASLGADGQSVILKKYFHIGVVVETAGGLLVPIIRDIDKKNLSMLAAELAAIAEKARTKGLSMAEMSGSSMCISSLGHIGGTAFTPIINAPDVAILGATAIQLRPMFGDDGGVSWCQMLPLSLSYDHRVINGADAARFVRAMGTKLVNPAIFEN